MNKLHIGYPKTATTYLQKFVFNQLKNHEFIGHPEFHKHGLIDLIWKADRSVDYQKFRELFKENKSFISFEELLGPIFQGSIMIDEIPLRLEKIFQKEIKILITIRRQDELLKSVYIQYIHQGGTMTFRNFITFSKYGINRIDLNAFNFYETYLRYSQIFGNDRIVFLPYELFKENRQKFLNKLEEFFEDESFTIPSNEIVYRSISGFQITFLRNLNRFLKSPISEKYIIPAKFINQDRLRRKLQKSNFLRIGEYFTNNDDELLFTVFKNFSESNKLLDEKMSLKLKEYGYY